MIRYQFITTLLLLATVISSHADQVIEEIVVTAQKRAQSINDVPVSISALDEAALEGAGVNDVTNMIPYVPGLNGQAAGMATNSWNIRGIGTNDWSVGSEPAIAVFMDEAYVGRNMLATAAFFDVERIEVVKGPQGTLFGRNASAGAINIITNKPADENSARLSYGEGSEDSRRIEIVGNLAVSDELAIRISALDKEMEGISENVFTGRDYFQEERSLRLMARWDVSDAVEVLLTGVVNDAEGNRVRPHNAGLAGLFGLPGGGDVFSSDVTSDSENREELDAEGIDLRVTWEISPTLTLTSITDFRDTEYSFTQDVDGIGVDLTVDLGDLFIGVPGILVASGPTHFFQPRVESETFSQEFRLNGTSDNVDWFVGVSYFDEDVYEEANFSWPVTMDLDVLFGGGGLLTVQTDADPAQYFMDGDIESTGVYGDISWHASDTVTLTAGIRWSRDEKSYCNRNTDPTFGFLLLLGPDTLGQEVCDSETWTEVTPRAVAAWSPNDNTMLYASYAKGYKGGGYNSAVAGSGIFGIEPPFALQSFDAENSDAWEAGAKLTLLNGSMQINVSAYQTDYEDLQLLDTDLSLSITNIGDVESQGVEMDLTWLPGIDGLAISGFLSTNDSEIDAPGFSIDGSELPQAPERTAGITLSYEHALGDAGTIGWFVGYNWQDDQLFDVNGARVEQSSYGLLDASVRFTAASGRWDLTLAGQNLNDEEFLIAASDPLALGLPLTLRNNPRIVMLQLGIHVGN